MGFGFNLFAAFVLPLLLLISAAVMLFYLIKRDYKPVKLLLKGWGIFFAMVILLVGIVYAIHFFTDKMKVKPEDVYGSYVIDKGKYSGKQSNWQYNHYRFEVTKQDSFLFYTTENGKVIKTYHGNVQFSDGGRITLKVDSPSCPVIDSSPTLYRNNSSFYYVFHTKCFKNVFFKKGTGKVIDLYN